MKKQKERNTEGKQNIAIIAGLAITAFAGGIEPTTAAIIIAGITVAYNLGRAYIKASPSKTDDKYLKMIDDAMAEFLKTKK